MILSADDFSNRNSRFSSSLATSGLFGLSLTSLVDDELSSAGFSADLVAKCPIRPPINRPRSEERSLGELSYAVNS